MFACWVQIISGLDSQSKFQLFTQYFPAAMLQLCLELNTGIDLIITLYLAGLFDIFILLNI